MSNKIPSSTNQLSEYIKGYVKRENTTKLLHKVTDFDDSLSELTDNNSYFSHHTNTPEYIKEGPLRECITVHLIDQMLTTDNYDKFPKTLLLLDKLIKIIEPNNKIITKVYVTRLPPKKQIYIHSDTDNSYWNTISRYQFYYTGNDNVIQKIDNTVYPVAPGYFYHFDHRQLHSYKNNSSDDLLLMVFDLLK
jgi:hypothetical protein